MEKKVSNAWLLLKYYSWFMRRHLFNYELLSYLWVRAMAMAMDKGINGIKGKSHQDADVLNE